MISSHRPLRVAWRVSGLAPAVFLALSTLAALAYFVAFLHPVTDGLDSVLPIDPADADPAIAVLSGIGLAALTVGLIRGKRVAWWLAMATLAVSLLAQAQAFAHPLGIVAVGGVLAVLLADRRRYVVETAVGARRIVVLLVLLGGLAVGLETALFIATTGDWPRPLAAVGDVTCAMANALGLDDSTANSILLHSSRSAILGLLLLASRLPLVLAALGILDRVPEPAPDPTTRALLRTIAERHGRGALLPFQLGEDKHVFSMPDVEGLIVYGLSGRTAVVLGDFIGPAESAPRVFGEFLARCHRLDRIPVVYQASSAARATLANAGFRLFKVGEEAVIDLSTFDTTGPRRANLRHTITRCRKDGVVVRWFPAGLPPELTVVGDDLASIDAAWCAKAGPRLRFTISGFDRAALGCHAVAVAVNPAGRAVAFATFRPTGADGGWVLDLMRRSPDSSPGAVEACIAEAAAAFRVAGATTLSLGLAPLANLDSSSPVFEERVLARCSRLVHRWYDVDGLARFKNKFDPTWVPRYGAVRHRRSLMGFVTSLLLVHLDLASLWPSRRLAAQPSTALGQ